MSEPRDPARQLRDELLGLSAFDPEDATAALVALEPEVEPDETDSEPGGEPDESDPTGADLPPA
jgi:hypothetical protein